MINDKQKKTNYKHSSRVLSFDLARGFTVLFIPAIHTAMLYSKTETYNSTIMLYLRFIAEGPGGQLLMCLMGIAVTFKPIETLQRALKRSVVLFATGVGLNIAKFVIPYLAGVLPDGVLQELQVANTSKTEALWLLSSMGDILHFAAIANIFLWMVTRSKTGSIWAIALGLAATLLSTPTILNCIALNSTTYALALFTSHPPRIFFPLLPWLLYPMSGFIIGKSYQKNAAQTMKLSAILGAIFTATGLLIDYTFPTSNPYGFYQTAPIATLWHLGIVLCTLSFWHYQAEQVKHNPFFTLLQFSSKNITLIYLIQWVMICWVLPWVGYRRMDLNYSQVMMVIITLNTYLLTFLIQLLKKMYAGK